LLRSEDNMRYPVPRQDLADFDAWSQLAMDAIKRTEAPYAHNSPAAFSMRRRYTAWSVGNPETCAVIASAPASGVSNGSGRKMTFPSGDNSAFS
jgi:hypothetical protein